MHVSWIVAPPVVNFLYCTDSSYIEADLLQADMRLHLLPETLYLAVTIIDCFLSVHVLSLAKLQLVGMRCVFFCGAICSQLPLLCCLIIFRGGTSGGHTSIH